MRGKNLYRAPGPHRIDGGAGCHVMRMLMAAMAVLTLDTHEALAEKRPKVSTPRMTYLSAGPVPLYFRRDPAPPVPASESAAEDEADRENSDGEDKDPAGAQSPGDENSDSGKEEGAEKSDASKDEVNRHAEGPSATDPEADQTAPLLEDENVEPFVAENPVPIGIIVDPLQQNWVRYRNAGIASMADMPEPPPQLGRQESKPVEPILITRRPHLDLTRGSYFGQSRPESTPDPLWESMGDSILEEMRRLSTDYPGPEGDSHSVQESLRRNPYPFGFLPPGPIWIPANESVTYSNSSVSYTNGNEK